MRLLRNAAFLAVALSHFIVDVLNGHMGILLAVLSVPLALTNAAIGRIATVYQLVGSLGQPLFGWLADRYGPRWTAAGGVLWMAFFFGLVAVAPGNWALVFLVLGSFGSAAFHPPGTMKAAQVGHRHMAGQVATAASVFFLFGQGGLSVGPAIAGVLMDHLGRPGLMLLAALTVPVGLFTAWALRPGALGEAAPARPRAETHASAAAERGASPDLLIFSLIMIMASLRTWAQAITTTFAPKFLQDQGVSPTVYGLIVAVFMGGSAIGGVLGGMAADRWGRRKAITVPLVLNILPFVLFPLVEGAWIFPVAALSGLLSGMPHPVFITSAQNSLPGRAALASGITLGLMFAAGAVGAYLAGIAGDAIGLRLVLQGNAVLVAVAAVVSLALWRQDRARAAVSAAGD